MVDVADLDADYRTLRHHVGAVMLERDAVRVQGPDAAAFLQGQLSQDIAGIDLGGAADSFVLSPQGKVDAFLRVIRMTGDEFVIDVDGGFGDLVATRLQRFKLRTKADIDLVDPWFVVGVRGPEADAALSGLDLDAAELMAIAVQWPGLVGFDVVGGRAPDVPGVPTCSAEAYEAIRIEAGLPRMGAEFLGSTIPAEAGVVDRSVSFTKGCFTGQELVARIDSRGGNVPRLLRGLVLATKEPPPPGSAVEVDGAKVGTVTSAHYSPGFGAAVALAYIHRRVEPPVAADVVWPGAGTRVAARVEVLPLHP